jgi:hypothetical protein
MPSTSAAPSTRSSARGAAALFIEDQAAPKRCGFVKGKELISLEEAVGKYRAACDVRDRLDPDFVIMARTDARGAVGGGMAEVLGAARPISRPASTCSTSRRCSRGRDPCGARGVPGCAPQGNALRDRPADHLPGGARLPSLHRGIHITKIGAIAMYDFLVEYRTRATTLFNEFAARHKSHPLGGFGIFDMTGFPHLLEMEKRYLPAETMVRYEQSLGVYDPRVGHMGRVKSAAG